MERNSTESAVMGVQKGNGRAAWGNTLRRHAKHVGLSRALLETQSWGVGFPKLLCDRRFCKLAFGFRWFLRHCFAPGCVSGSAPVSQSPQAYGCFFGAMIRT